jgi:hypothetical protein
MKLTDKPTDWIIIKASTNSEWDNVDFALFSLTEPWISWVKKYVDAAMDQGKGDYGFYNISLWCAPDGWYRNHLKDSDEELIEEDVLESIEWSYIDLEGQELDEIDVPENKIRTDILKIKRDGGASFVAHGEYTGEEFYTEDFPLIDFIHAYKNKTKSSVL